MKFLFSERFVTIFNVDQYSHYKLGHLLSLLLGNLRTMDSFWWQIWKPWHINFYILHILEYLARLNMWPCTMNLKHFHRNTLNMLLTINWQVWRKNLKSQAPPMAPLGIKTFGLGRNMCFPCHFCIRYESLLTLIFEYFWNQEGVMASSSFVDVSQEALKLGVIPSISVWRQTWL